VRRGFGIAGRAEAAILPREHLLVVDFVVFGHVLCEGVRGAAADREADVAPTRDRLSQDEVPGIGERPQKKEMPS